MRKVEDLRSGWEQQQATAKDAAEQRKRKKAFEASEFIDDNDRLQEEPGDAPSFDATADLFNDSSDEDKLKKEDVIDKEIMDIAAKTTQHDLFGDTSDEDGDEEFSPSFGTKRGSNDRNNDGEPDPKKRKSAPDIAN